MTFGKLPPTADPEWLTLGQAARFLGVAQSTIRKWSDRGRVRAFYTPGGHRRYRRDDLEAFLERSGPARAAAAFVLLVEEDERVRGRVRGMLEAEGYSVGEAGGLEQAMAAIEHRRPDLVLLGTRTAPLDGWELLRRIQEGSGADAIPVSLFGGESDLRQLVERTKRIAPL